MLGSKSIAKALWVMILLVLPVSGCASQDNELKDPTSTDQTPIVEETAMESFFEIQTNHGKLVVKLYNETPIHRDNFIKLVSEGFYNGTSFHRVMAGFMIQGGDPNSKDDDPYNDGMGDPGYTLEAEINADLFNRRGALVAARQPDQVNPERRSSGSQFYIVQGQAIPDESLTQMEQQISTAIGRPFSYTAVQRDIYMTTGGAPWLDMQYSVFGELVEGFDVLDAIAATDTPRSTGQGDPRLADMPLERIEMTITRLDEYTPPSN